MSKKRPREVIKSLKNEQEYWQETAKDAESETDKLTLALKKANERIEILNKAAIDLEAKLKEKDIAANDCLFIISQSTESVLNRLLKVQEILGEHFPKDERRAKDHISD